MDYREMLHAIDSLKALEILGVQADTNGAYVRFPCPSKCKTSAIIKTYGDKKNLLYCRSIVRRQEALPSRSSW